MNRELSNDEINAVQEYLERKARDEAEANEPDFAEYAADELTNNEVGALVVAVLTGDMEKMHAVRYVADRVVRDWTDYRTGEMDEIDHERARENLFGYEDAA